MFHDVDLGDGSRSVLGGGGRQGGGWTVNYLQLNQTQHVSKGREMQRHRNIPVTARFKTVMISMIT